MLLRLAIIAAALVAATAVLLAVTRPERSQGSVPHRVYVMLGFHTNFYHSWRGDTPDEAGFGTDIRIVREILRMLDDANARGQEARGYWDSDNHFTLETIIPAHAPDIIDGIRRRVERGLDEVLVAPYNNGLFSAMTEDEMRANLRWAVSNPWGSGVADLFGTYTPIVRPQEYMFTSGSIPILESEGMRGVILAYSNYPFTSFSNFIPPLPPEQRYNPLWLRTEPHGPRTIVLPAVSIGDVVNFVSFEKWLLDLRRLQTSGEVRRDLLLHINFDADAETWLPLDLPRGLRWIPNTGGLLEYIEAVNKYEWAVFTTPGEYLKTHPPAGEIVVRQDLADGGWDGNYSWAEKAPSHTLWTALEKSRLAAVRARAVAAGAADEIERKLEKLLAGGRDGSFFQRIRALSTTHFGMSTPLVNEERQAVAEQITHTALQRAVDAERLAAMTLSAEAPAPGDLYELIVQDIREHGVTMPQLVRVPVILSAAQRAITLLDEVGQPSQFALLNVEPLGSDRITAELWFQPRLGVGERKRFRVRAAGAPPAKTQRADLHRLANPYIELVLDRTHGVRSLRLRGEVFGGEQFLDPFITYRSGEKPYVARVGAYEVGVPAGEITSGFERAELRGRMRFPMPDGNAESEVRVRFTLPEDAPWIVADVEVHYARTPKHDLLHTVQQKLRRYLDLRWIEVAPFQLHPDISATRAAPLRVWKHNWLGVTSHYDLDYGRINPANAELDSFNHHVTAGWVAVSNGEKGMLLGHCADILSSYAFAPMRLRERDGVQRIWVNPFGSYHGRQMDYSHLGGNGLGTEIAVLEGAQFRSNAPSYNGRSERFSLLIAPYAGDAPPHELREIAGSFFRPPAVVYVRTPADISARLPADVRDVIDRERQLAARQRGGPLAAPASFLANPTDAAVDLVWDEPDDPRCVGYEIAWKESAQTAWTTERIGRGGRHRIAPLTNGRRYDFRLRALGEGAIASGWTEPQTCLVGPVPVVPMSAKVLDFEPFFLLRVLLSSIRHALVTL